MKSDNKNIGNRLVTFDYRTHHRMPKIKFPKKRRRVDYKGIVNLEPVKTPPEPMLFDAKIKE